MANKIRQAYEQGLRIRFKGWLKFEWIKKHSNLECITDVGSIFKNNWSFYNEPEIWEIYHEDLHLFKQPDTLPDTLIINGIKYKRDDN